MDESFKETCPRGEPLEEMLIKVLVCLCALQRFSSIKDKYGYHGDLLQSCPDAIDEVFDSKLHIIAGVGIAMGVVMVRN